MNLTTALGRERGLRASLEPQWKTSVYGGYAEVSYNTQANAMLCSLEGGGNGTGAGSNAVATAGCDNDWNVWWVGSRTQWNVTKDFYMGVDVHVHEPAERQHLVTASCRQASSCAARTSRSATRMRWRSNSASTRTSIP